MLFGIYFRSVLYFLDRPFWHDEAALALNLEMPITNFFKHLNFGQAAPPLFMIISKFLSQSEMLLRLVPFIAGICSIFVFYKLCEKIFTSKFPVLICLTLFALNMRLIYYSQEFKPYSTDMMIFMCVILSYFYLDFEKLSKKTAILLGFCYAILPWLSYTSTFAIFSVFLLKIFNQKCHFKKILIATLPIAISGFIFILNQKFLNSDYSLHTFWADAFFEYDFSNFYSIFMNSFKYIYKNVFVRFFAVITFIAGFIYSCYHFKEKHYKLILLTLFVPVLFSYFKIYPFGGRLILYLIPIYIVCSCISLDKIYTLNKFIKYPMYLIIFYMVTINSLMLPLTEVTFNRFKYEDIVTPLKAARALMFQSLNNECLYIPRGSGILYEYYAKKLGLNFKNIITESKNNDISESINALDKLEKDKTYYYIFAHHPRKKEMLDALYAWGKNKDNFKFIIDKSLNALIIFRN